MIKANNVLADGLQVSWEVLYGIDAGALTNATRKNFLVEIVTHPDFPDGSKAKCTYYGTGALTLSEFANLPDGSTIECPKLATPTLYWKVAAKGTATFKSTTVNT